MNEWINDELLSAYLDGEVTAEEQAKIEKLLASQPQARQLLDELRALSGALQSLPPARLETDLSDRVIRAAQRQILTGGEAAADSTGTAGSLWTQLRKRLTGRALFWPAVAAVLALWIVLTDLGRVGVAPHQREIVNATDPLKHAPAGGDAAVGAMGSNRVAANSVGVDAASVGARGDAASSEITSTSEAGAAVPAPKPAMIGPVASGDEAVARKANDESERLNVGSAAAKPRNGAADPGEPMAYGAAHAPQRPVERRSMAVGSAGGGAGNVGAAMPPPAAMAAAPLPAADDLRSDGAPTTAARAPEDGRRSGIASVDALMEEATADSEAAEEGILVVHVDIAADAARNDVFGQLLAQNYILWEPDPALAGASGWNSLNPLWRATDADASAGRSDAPTTRDKAAPAVADSDTDGRGAADQKTKENQMAFREPLQPGGLRGAADPSDQGGVPPGNGEGRGSVARAMKGTAAASPTASAPPAAIEPEAGDLPAASPIAQRPSLAKSEGQAFGGVPEGAALRALKAPPSPEIELVYVEAQASQIQNLIADLTDAHQSVVSVAVEPARGTQNFAAQQRGRPVGQLAQTRALPSPPPGEAISGGGQKRLMADGLPAQPEEGRAIRSPDMPAEHLPKSAPGVEGPLSGAGAASRQLAGEYNAATAENERLQQKADRAEREWPESKPQADRIPQFGRAAEQGASNEGPAGGQVVLGRAHRVARLDAQNQVAGHTWKDQMAAAPAQGGKAVAEPAEGGSASAQPDAADALLHDGSRQALVRREAGQPLGAAPDAVELVEKAKQGDDGAGRDSSLVRPGSQMALPHVARQQRVLFVLRTVPAVQAAAARPQGFAPAAAPADAVASPDAERAAPPGEANGGETRDDPAPNSAPQ